MPKKPLTLCVAGPTASGKTDAAVAVCRAISGEVLSMDSMQIYRGLDIGTAKPAASEMGGVPHHLLSFVPPDMPYTVADYQRDARAAADEVRSRGKLPVFCGGTGLYLTAISRPLTFSGAHDDGKVRARLEKEAQAPGGPEALLARLYHVDPEAANRLPVSNIRRIIRALEIFELTGAPMSARAGEWEAEPDEPFLIFALTYPRETLYARIDARVDRMIAQGLVEEVNSLLQGGLSPDSQAMQAIGYKEIASALRGECVLSEAIDRVKLHSRRYAKRQLTWLRRDSRVVWVNVPDFSSTAAMHAFLIDVSEREVMAH